MMKSGHSHAKLCLRTVLNPILISLALGCLFTYVECRWCTKVQSYETVRTILQPSKCNQSYQDSCGWFTQEQCTYYDITDCLLQKNKSVVRYRMLTDCCAGFKLDPDNNVTCIEDSGFSRTVVPKIPSTDKKGGNRLDKATDTNPPSTEENAGAKGGGNHLDKMTDANPPSTEENADAKGSNRLDKMTDTNGPEPAGTKAGVEKGNGGGPSESGEAITLTTPSLVTYAPRKEEQTVESKPVKHDSDDNIFLNLSSGAYTGIICACVFVLCVLILIGLHLWKKQRRLKKKAAEESVQMDATQKMLTASPKV